MVCPRTLCGRIFCILLAYAFIYVPLAGPSTAAQSTDSPFYETRGVWLATVLGDGNWPTTGAPANTQAEKLRELIRDADDVGINLFAFQVVARGDAMYRSDLLPWSARLAGPGVDPGYDPLQVAIDEAHSLGMELHAWINIYRIGDTSTLSLFEDVSDPQHIGFAEPGWIAEKGAQVWLDPSAAGAKEWLVSIVEEIVTNYDVDGVHFDFIRYPEGGFPNDQANFQFDPRGFNDLGDWRRDNVSQFVEAAHTAVSAIKPWVKVGSAPLGNYRETSAWPALWAFSEVYQESRKWLQEGWHDYLAPQIYFSIGTTPEGSNTWKSPDFSILVEEWVDESSNRPIFAGYAPYKPAEGRFPAADLPLQIDKAREVGAAGQMAFRYDHLMQYADLISPKYEHKSVPAAMFHRFEAAAPTVPTGLALTHDATGAPQLSWLASSGSTSDPLRSYVILRRENEAPIPNEPADILAMVNGDVTSFSDTEADISKSYHYSIAARSALGVVSNYSESVATQSVVSVENPNRDKRKTSIVSVFPNPASQSATLTYYLSSSTEVQIAIHDAIGRRARELTRDTRYPGLYKTEINTTNLSNGVYHVVMRTKEGLSSWPFIVRR